jgi:pSer/pThr/pTyr-binding forkhead associated (FHA) protein
VTKDDDLDLADTDVVDGSESTKLQALIVIDGKTQTIALPLTGELRIGRYVGSDIHIEHSSISRFHAVLRLAAPMTIEDLGSANGTRVRDRPLKPGHPTPVAVGDVITLGTVTMILQRRRPVGPPVGTRSF